MGLHQSAAISWEREKGKTRSQKRKQKPRKPQKLKTKNKITSRRVIPTYLSQILTFFVLNPGEDEEERIILMKSRALRSLDFIRIILSSSSLLLVGGPAVTAVMLGSNNFRRETPGRLQTPRRLEIKIWIDLEDIKMFG